MRVHLSSSMGKGRIIACLPKANICNLVVELVASKSKCIRKIYDLSTIVNKPKFGGKRDQHQIGWHVMLPLENFIEQLDMKREY